jgi:8-oxo-dGTP diphosphatase
MASVLANGLEWCEIAFPMIERPKSLPFKISTLIFVRDLNDRVLLIQRAKAPNKGCWSPIGGKLDMQRGESPYECARRETMEEIGLKLNDQDLHCFGYISEKHYENQCHWLMFLFHCRVQLQELPQAIDEGQFAFFLRSEVDKLELPETDRRLLWPYYDRNKQGFVGLRADCMPGQALHVVEELVLPGV